MGQKSESVQKYGVYRPLTNDCPQCRTYNILQSIAFSEDKMKKRWKILVLALLAIGLLYLHNRYHITAEQILSWQPENMFLAAFILLLLFAVKSTLVFVPIMIPQILVGHLYTRDIAILLNLLGLMIVMTVPYWIGKRLGSHKVEHMLHKYPKIRILLKAQEENQMAFSFMLRACSVPPPDVVTMYLGATGIPFTTNLVGGVLGCFPGMVLTTFLGSNIRNPESPAFWKALALNVIWVLLSGLGFYLYRKFCSKEDVCE